MAVYGHNTLFEQRVPLARCNAFHEYALRVAWDKEDQFYDSWKSFRAANPVEIRAGGGVADDSESEKLLKLLAGDTDDSGDDVPAAAAAAAPASAAPAPAAPAPAPAAAAAAAAGGSD